MSSSTARFLVLALGALAGCTKELVCPSDQASCGGACTAIATDPANCGACGVGCGPGGACVAGACTCGPGATACGPACADLQSDPWHCGTCGTACPASQVCTTSGLVTACASSCAPGQTSCDRACVDLSSSRYACGACSRACGTNERCERGLCLADVYAACWDSNGPQVRGATLDLEPAGVPLPTDSGPVRFASIGDTLYVASSLSSTLTGIAFDPPAVRSTYQGSPYGSAIPIAVPAGTYPDLEFLAADGGLLYASNAAAGTLVVVDPAKSGGKTVDEIPLASPPDWPNPQGIAFDHGAAYDRAYVALYGMNQVAVVDVSLSGTCTEPPCGSVVHRIAVQQLADTGGQAEPSRMAVAGGKLYVTLSNLTAGWPPDPAGNGKLAVIDLATHALDVATPSVDLGPNCKNAADVTALGEVLYATCGMLDFKSSATPKPVLGTSIVPVDVSGSTPTVGKPVAVPDPIAPGRLAFCGGAGYAGDRNGPALVRFDPATGDVATSTAICPASAAFVPDVTCAP